jgi:hypothetical protein
MAKHTECRSGRKAALRGGDMTFLKAGCNLSEYQPEKGGSQIKYLHVLIWGKLRSPQGLICTLLL